MALSDRGDIDHLADAGQALPSGLEWLSGALLGIMLGLAWATVIGIAYRQRALSTFSSGIASAVFYGVLFVVMFWQTQVNSGVELERLRAARAQTDLSMAQWWASGWQELPGGSHRCDLGIIQKIQCPDCRLAATGGGLAVRRGMGKGAALRLAMVHQGFESGT